MKTMSPLDSLHPRMRAVQKELEKHRNAVPRISEAVPSTTPSTNHTSDHNNLWDIDPDPLRN
ncbi:hypothetical protein N7481_003202 [Penicillium waksmanii]|uniref:uncharacterized protein n=1 Tax=Penicillium waksmanii TaxID=69791 RepID=UPI0025497D77|nr:uncharacterized protein N7481_003202 [Penicillium waksmanii]KAJ5987992.1 hypothetical protein N7481_003202 [Penicillium waksmanii]